MVIYDSKNIHLLVIDLANVLQHNRTTRGCMNWLATTQSHNHSEKGGYLE